MSTVTRRAAPLITLLYVALVGVMAGFFFAWGFSAMPGFARADGPLYVTAMQLINEEVRNPVFALAFFGPLPLAPLAIWLAWDTPARNLLIFSALCYLVAVGVTSFVNVPINRDMATWNTSALPERWLAMRDTWTEANHFRTALSTAAFFFGLFGLYRLGGVCAMAMASLGGSRVSAP